MCASRSRVCVHREGVIDRPIQSIERGASIFRRYENFISSSYNDIKVMYRERDSAGMETRSTLVELSINFVHYSTINRAPTRGTPSIPVFGGVLIIDIGDVQPRRTPRVASLVTFHCFRFNVIRGAMVFWEGIQARLETMTDGFEWIPRAGTNRNERKKKKNRREEFEPRYRVTTGGYRNQILLIAEIDFSRWITNHRVIFVRIAKPSTNFCFFSSTPFRIAILPTWTTGGNSFL